MTPDPKGPICGAYRKGERNQRSRCDDSHHRLPAFADPPGTESATVFETVAEDRTERKRPSEPGRGCGHCEEMLSTPPEKVVVLNLPETLRVLGHILSQRRAMISGVVSRKLVGRPRVALCRVEESGITQITYRPIDRGGRGERHEPGSGSSDAFP